MANIKISQLQEASLPLNGDEYIPMDQGPVTVKTTVSGLFLGADLSSAKNVPLASTVGVLGLSGGGTGFDNAQEALNNLLPKQLAQSGKVLGTDGVIASWVDVSSISGVSSISIDPDGYLGMNLSITPTDGVGNVVFYLGGTLNLASLTAQNNALPLVAGGTGASTWQPAINALTNVSSDDVGKYLGCVMSGGSPSVPNVAWVTGGGGGSGVSSVVGNTGSGSGIYGLYLTPGSPATGAVTIDIKGSLTGVPASALSVTSGNVGQVITCANVGSPGVPTAVWQTMPSTSGVSSVVGNTGSGSGAYGLHLTPTTPSSGAVTIDVSGTLSGVPASAISSSSIPSGCVLTTIGNVTEWTSTSSAQQAALNSLTAATSDAVGKFLTCVNVGSPGVPTVQWGSGGSTGGVSSVGGNTTAGIYGLNIQPQTATTGAVVLNVGGSITNLPLTALSATSANVGQYITCVNVGSPAVPTVQWGAGGSTGGVSSVGGNTTAGSYGLNIQPQTATTGAVTLNVGGTISGLPVTALAVTSSNVGQYLTCVNVGSPGVPTVQWGAGGSTGGVSSVSGNTTAGIYGLNIQPQTATTGAVTLNVGGSISSLPVTALAVTSSNVGQYLTCVNVGSPAVPTVQWGAGGSTGGVSSVAGSSTAGIYGLTITPQTASTGAVVLNVGGSISGLPVSALTGGIDIPHGGTGATAQQAALNNLTGLNVTTESSGTVLTVNGTNVVWANNVTLQQQVLNSITNVTEANLNQFLTCTVVGGVPNVTWGSGGGGGGTVYSVKGTPSGGLYGLTIAATPNTGVGNVTLDLSGTLRQIPGSAIIGGLTLAQGGTGANTAQAAINNLTGLGQTAYSDGTMLITSGNQAGWATSAGQKQSALNLLTSVTSGNAGQYLMCSTSSGEPLVVWGAGGGGGGAVTSVKGSPSGGGAYGLTISATPSTGLGNVVMDLAGTISVPVAALNGNVQINQGGTGASNQQSALNNITGNVSGADIGQGSFIAINQASNAVWLAPQRALNVITSAASFPYETGTFLGIDPVTGNATWITQLAALNSITNVTGAGVSTGAVLTVNRQGNAGWADRQDSINQLTAATIADNNKYLGVSVYNETANVEWLSFPSAVTSVGVSTASTLYGITLTTTPPAMRGSYGLTTSPITGAGTIYLEGAVDLSQMTPVLNHVLPVACGGTGGISQQTALNNLCLTDVAGVGNFLTYDGSNIRWSQYAPGTTYSVGVDNTHTSCGLTLGTTVSGPITTSGSIYISGSVSADALSGVIPFSGGGTGQSDQQAAINALTDVNGVSDGRFLAVASGDAVWSSYVPGTVSSIGVETTATPSGLFLQTSTSGSNTPITVSGSLSIGGSIDLGTMQNSANGFLPYSCGGFPTLATGVLGQVLMSSGSAATWGDMPIQSVVGSGYVLTGLTVSCVTYTNTHSVRVSIGGNLNLSEMTQANNNLLPVVAGGTGASSQNAAFNNIAPPQSSGTVGMVLASTFNGTAGVGQWSEPSSLLNLSAFQGSGQLPVNYGGTGAWQQKDALANLVPLESSATVGHFLMSNGGGASYATWGAPPNVQTINLSTLTVGVNGALPAGCGGVPTQSIATAGAYLTSSGASGASWTQLPGVNLSSFTVANGSLPAVCGGFANQFTGSNGQILVSSGVAGANWVNPAFLSSIEQNGSSANGLSLTASSTSGAASIGITGHVVFTGMTSAFNGVLPVQCGGVPAPGTSGQFLVTNGTVGSWQTLALGSLSSGTNGVLPDSCGGFSGRTLGSAGQLLVSSGSSGTTWVTSAYLNAITQNGSSVSGISLTASYSGNTGTIGIAGNLGLSGLTSGVNGVLPTQCGGFPTTTFGTAGQVLTSTGSSATWQSGGGVDLASPGPIGGTTPSTGAFTSLTSTLDVTFNGVKVGRGLASVATNTAVGTGTLATITTGSTSTAVGCQALNKVSIASGNTAVGNNALSSTITGGNNTAVGDNALGACTTSYNVAVGTRAGAAITTGTSNVAVGFNSLLTATTSAGQVAVGYGALQLATGTSNVAVGYNSLSSLTTGASNTAIGYLAMSGSSTTATSNVAVGISSLLNGNGGQNVAVGGLSLGATGNTAANNVAVGYQSMQANTTGTNNVGIGTQSLQANLSGGNNVAVGTGACCLGTNASAIVGIGNTALFNNTTGPNTAVGNNSLKALTSGNNNVAVGDNAGLALTTGTNSTFIGHNAGLSLTTGSGNAFIGNSSGSSVTTGSNNVVLGGYTGASVGGSFDLTTATGYIVLSAGDGTGRCIIDSSNNLILGNKGQNGLITYSTQSTAINSNGSIYCYGTFATTTSYTAGSPSYFANYNSVGTLVNFFSSGSQHSGSINVNAGATTYGTTSDYRLKENVQPLTGSGEFIDALKPVSFEWISDGRKASGFIAHEFAEVSPDSVSGEKDAVDESGDPIYQNMEASSSGVIANIVLELQVLRKRLYEAEQQIKLFTNN